MIKKILLFAFGVPLIVGVFFWHSFRYHDTIVQAEQILVQDSRVLNWIGDDPTLSIWVNGTVSGSADNRTASFRFELSGSRGSGMAHTRGKNQGAGWRLTEVHFTPDAPGSRKFHVSRGDKD
ncbi:MAG: cytochrome c oxidase assembly factor Coa1 family protein [bacterium]|nr:cytochrome c oxidase assembly factor Coa1 family protein [bacterium]